MRALLIGILLVSWSQSFSAPVRDNFPWREWGEAAFQEAMSSEIGIQLIHALKPWSEAKIITWFFSEAFEESIAVE